MRNYIQPGEVIDFVNTTGAAIASGDAVIIGKRVGVAAVDIPDNNTGSVDVCGVYELPKGSGAISQGAEVYLTAAGNITTTGSGNTLAGYAFSAAASGDGTVEVAINA